MLCMTDLNYIIVVIKISRISKKEKKKSLKIIGIRAFIEPDNTYQFKVVLAIRATPLS